jgi:hypothetical protein
LASVLLQVPYGNETVLQNITDGEVVRPVKALFLVEGTKQMSQDQIK